MPLGAATLAVPVVGKSRVELTPVDAPAPQPLNWINEGLSGECIEGGSMTRLSGPWKTSGGSWRTSGGGCARC